MTIELKIALTIITFFAALTLIVPWVVLSWIWVEMPNTTSTLAACTGAEATNSDQCTESYNMLIKQVRGDYQAWSMEHRATSFLWQQASTIASFFVMSGIIFVGIGLAVFEFIKGKSGVTTLKFGSSGIEVSSEIIGIIVLTISLGFAYVYIDRIYPINEVSQTDGVSE